MHCSTLHFSIEEGIGRLHAGKDICKDSTNTHKEATPRMAEVLNLQTEYAQAEMNFLFFIL
ncbi:MAG: hypothetical protein QXN16_01325 [Candidatus Micrarchaeaceae archaeon]